MSTIALTRPVSRVVADENGASFVASFTVCLLLMSVPIKNFGYIVPPTFVALQFLFGNYRFVKQTVFWMCFAACLSMAALLADSLGGRIVNLPGLFMGLLTYMTLFVVLGARSSFSLDARSRDQLVTVVAWWLIIQSSLGLLQFAVSRNSDAVCGTMGLFEFIYPETITITQVYFTFDLFAMILYLVLYIDRGISKIAVALGLVACALAHSGHQTIFMMAALAFVGVFQMRLKDVLKIGAVLAALLALTVSVSEIYLDELKHWAEYSFREKAPKRMGADGALKILSEPKNLLVGAGMGQYSSRAALITSGEGVTADLPSFLLGQSIYYRDYLVPAHEVFEEEGEGSAISKPYSTAVNMPAEFGIVMTLFFLICLAIEFFRNQLKAKSRSSDRWMLGILSNVGIVFFVLCCFIENYLEFPQAVFIPALLYIGAHASAPVEHSARQHTRHSRV